MDFDVRRRLKWIDGREERGLAHDEPFQGDPILEALGETPDLANYIDQAIHDGRMPEQVGRELIRKVRDVDGVISLYR